VAETYELIQQRIFRMLNDPGAATFTDALVYDGVKGAHDAILPWVPKMAEMIVTSGSDGHNLIVPTDLYLTMAVQKVDTGEFLRKATMAPGTVRHSDQQSIAIDWIEYPRGYINLGVDVGEGTEFKIFYLAYWSIPEDETDLTFELEVPRHAHQGLIYYAAANCLAPSAVNSATIRQYALRIDSGTPEDNPLKVEAQHFLERFYQEMKLMPAFTKVGI
jgi:hypothetical protein